MVVNPIQASAADVIPTAKVRENVHVIYANLARGVLQSGTNNERLDARDDIMAGRTYVSLSTAKCTVTQPPVTHILSEHASRAVGSRKAQRQLEAWDMPSALWHCHRMHRGLTD